MSKVDGYGVYQNSYHQNKVNQKKNTDAKSGRTDRNKKTDKTGRQQQDIRLSSNAKKLLEELKQTYGNMDFIVADYEGEEEAQEYLSRGTKEYSVLIDPETLEEMAANKDVKEKYLGIIEDATGKFSDIKEKLGDRAADVVSLGVSIDKNGNVSYFAELEKMGEAQRERIEKAKEERQEEKARDRRNSTDRTGRRDNRFIQEGAKRTTVQSDSIEGLLSEIQKVDWSQIKGDGGQVNGDRFDFSI